VVVVALIAALVAIVAGGCAPSSPSAEGSRRHLVVVAIDALRSDHTGLGGYAVATTPRLDRLAGDSLVFEQARAASSYTLQSVAAIFTGRLPSSGGSIGLLEAQPAEESVTLASALRRAGWRTMLATNQPLLSGRGFTRGFDDVAVATAEQAWPCGEVVNRALAAFDVRAEGQPRFVYLQMVEPHEPHEAPAAQAQRFADPYDAEIAAADECLGALVDGIRSRGALDATTLVVTGTQGEELGEHGDTGSGWTLYDEVLRVPLLVRAPGVVEPGRTGAPASVVDLYPTLLALASIAPTPQESAALDGRALLASRGGRFRADDDATRPVIAELVIPQRAIVRAVIAGKLKYLATIKTHPPAQRAAVAASYFDLVAAAAKDGAAPQPLWQAPRREELYDLAVDPRETDDLSARPSRDASTRIDALRAVLERYEQRCREHGLAARQARPRAALPTAEEIENLKSLSYL
jgi:arylsulfatase A-like enzyme